MSNRIEKSVELKAPVDRVWQALTDHIEFGKWFGVALDQPFVEGAGSSGHMTIPGFEHLAWNAAVVAIEPKTRFAYRWHPYAIDSERDYSGEPMTLVEFTLMPAGDGTRLTVVESGFDALPAERRDEALRSNTGGWEAQIRNIATHVGG